MSGSPYLGLSLGTSTLSNPNLTIQNELTTPISTTALGGSFTLVVRNTTTNSQSGTTSLAYNSTAAQIESALNALSNLAGNTFTVTGTGIPANPWMVSGGLSFDIELNSTDLLSFVANSFTPGNIPFWTNAIGGTFTLEVSAMGASATTAALPYNSSAAQVAAAISQLALPGLPTVTVTGSGTSSDPWVVSGQGLASLGMGPSQLETPFHVTVGAIVPGTISFSNNASSGTFALTLTNILGQSATTTPLAWNSTASQIAAALNQLTNPDGTTLASGLTVTQTGTSAWTVTGQGIVNLFSTPALSGVELALQGVSQGSVNLSTTATGGTFTLTVTNALGQSATTAPLAFNSTATDIATALNTLTNSVGTSLVSGLTVTGAGTTGNPWVVTGGSAVDHARRRAPHRRNGKRWNRHPRLRVAVRERRDGWNLHNLPRCPGEPGHLGIQSDRNQLDQRLEWCVHPDHRR